MSTKQVSVANGAQGEITFPDPAKSLVPEGTFVSPENLRLVSPGMTKDQLYRLLGTPQFDEGVFHVTKWNYIFNFRRDDGEADFDRCQYQIIFDANHHVQSTHWKPESCRLMVEKPKPVDKAAPVDKVAPLDKPAPAMQTETAPDMSMPDDPITLSGDALFGFNSASLTDDGRESLGKFMQEVLIASQVQDILVVGYSDRIGSSRANLKLSTERAESVRDYLVQGGVPAAAIHSEGKGSDKPVVKCTNRDRTALIACLSPNRRVELSGRPKH